MFVRLALFAVSASLVNPANAHGWDDNADEDFFSAMLGGLLPAALWLIYVVGAGRIRPTNNRRLMFHGASLLAVMTMFGSTGGWLDESSTLHMVQHMLILVVIAPLYVLARPLPQWLAVSGRIGIRLWKPFLRLSRHPLRTGILQSLVIWFWHTPVFYNLALASPWWHLAEHLSFAFASGLFWWSILLRRTLTVLPALLLTLMSTGMLGALLTFAQTPFYNDLLNIQDQQLAGLIMWVPGGLFYLLAGGWCSLRLFTKCIPIVDQNSVPGCPSKDAVNTSL
ncbi:cytochrome c oxidase assembly protein [Methylotuvimicrobium buryatense]|uniref:Cytochrome c oxidase assembly protein n=1 Tax=Methylotuvimicrobium buryatense TaxID=95641 RepID=A0A4P9ULW3_METBY|nr:cytochrome c oxidase assembly protein [Methylotuvimicrobium buryatense]QCW82234.1 cytochrome c oxidase assembly protein [Methylotuvimicrobium buryatense]